METRNDVEISGDKPRLVARRAVHRLHLLAALGISLLQGCAVGPDYFKPEVQTPDRWHQELTKGVAGGEADLRTWWVVLNDPVLESLIDRAGAGNLELKEAIARVREARARRGVATGELWPSVGGTGSYRRTRVSENGLFAPPLESNLPEKAASQLLSTGASSAVPGLGGLLPPITHHTTPDQTNLHSVGFDASWEIDVFGGIRRNIESADAGLQATIEGYRDVLVSLYAEVALNYVEVRALQARLAYARSNVDAQRKSVQLTTDRLKAGIAPELDVAQAESNLASTESEIPTLEIALTQTVNRLGVLMGESPSALHDLLGKAAAIPVPPAETTIGLPADLLRQRPDVRRAERELASATAQIGVATADLYPRFSLSGTFALEGTQVKDLGKMDSRAWSFGPSFRWNIFDGIRNIYRIQAAEAVTEQTLIRYEQTVLAALEDVENAMVAYKKEQIRRDALIRAADASKRAVALVRTLYETGLTDFQNVLDAQRSLFQQQDELAQSEGRVTGNLISLYKALGGGWDPDLNNLEDGRMAAGASTSPPAMESNKGGD